MNNLAFGYKAAGKLNLALPLYRESLELGKAKLGVDHPDTLTRMNNLAASYQAAGKLELALTLKEETFKLRKAKLGPDHPDTLTSMNNLAVGYQTAGKLDLALPLYEETLKLRKAKLGVDHPDTLVTMNNLAAGYRSAGRSQDALELRKETLKLMKASLGTDHPDTLRIMNNLAVSYAAAGRTRDALELYEEACKRTKAKLGPDHPDTLRSMNNMVISWVEAGRAADAISLLKDTLASRQRRAQADPGNTMEEAFLALTHGQLGEAEQARYDYAAAVTEYATSVATFSKLDQAGALGDFFLRGRFAVFQQRLATCRKAEQAVADLDFALKQPAAEVPELLDMRLRALATKNDLPGVIATAAALARLAEKDAAQCYNAACAWSLASGLAKDDSKLRDEYAGNALALLKKAKESGKSFPSPGAMATRMKEDKDLDPLREREDFKKFLAELGEASPKR
jgi:hypothetical protein